MEAQDSRTIRFARRVLASDTGRKLHRAAVDHRPRSAFGRLGRALAFAADGWMGGDDRCSRGAGEPLPPLCEGARGRATLEVHTRPPIHWLNFHRAGEAIRAGDEALDGLIPRLRNALAEWTNATAAARTAVRIATPVATTGGASATV